MAEDEKTGSTTDSFRAPPWLHQRPVEADRPALPRQHAPRHDDMLRTSNVSRVPFQAAWTSRNDTGIVGPLALAVTGLMTPVGIAFAVDLRTPSSLALPAFTASVFLVILKILAAGAGARVSLNRSVLEVQTRQGPRLFDLALPDVAVSISESPHDPSWQLVLDDHQHRPVVLTRRDVPPGEVAPIVRHYRAIADARAASRAFRPED